MAAAIELPDALIAEENPDLPYRFIKDILPAEQEESIPFTFGEDG
ncbi:MAG: hypothetical protein BECKG1743D_GA0114223_101228 [Candidatus Kentron sp. G]|nr:MAG: hypothetical protein BECKG1743F_GA0114225_102136 [Candidatus Kentron sp. G]VFM98537.1 MAG: hypothetical protein BECKG1743E_GA0114224_101956 [Candidatus Kentron sp. G]VFM99439.1 MAG: hypothetical protein BECKG1743D_GA0114223_101228 [Candidatus Kentron sp. G]